MLAVLTIYLGGTAEWFESPSDNNGIEPSAVLSIRSATIYPEGV